MNFGDYVEVLTGEKKYKGFLIKSEDPSVIKLKLDDGYNIGISKRKIKKIKVLKKAKRTKKKPLKVRANPDLPNVTILSTGGTISSKVDYVTGGVSPAISAEDFVEENPELLNFANISARQIVKKLSEDISIRDWKKIANEVYKEIKKGVEGIVITHGTDTMAFSASALAFSIRNLPIPVIFVGAQRSVDRGSSDAFPNLKVAVIAASRWDGAESVISMHATSNDTYNYLIRGVRARKMHTSRRDAFRPINDFPLAKVFYEGQIESLSDYKKRGGKAKLNTKFNEKVALLYAYPTLSKDLLESYSKFDGVVIAGTGLGHIPSSLIPSIKKLTKKGVYVVMTSQCLYGRVNPYVYSTGRKLEKAGVIYAGDMLPEVAYVKLMKVLAEYPNEVREKMLENWVGELSNRSLYGSFMV